MPDRDWQTVSASQAAALFNQSPYLTRWMLWKAFQAKSRALIEPPETARMSLGKLYQSAILVRAAADHRLEIVPNEADEYVRRGQLGCTRDAHMVMPDLGRVIVEAKRVHWLRWRETWTETAAPLGVEIQLQQQLLVEDCGHGLIVCDNGDDDLKYYRRERNGELADRLREEAALFFESLERNDAPDPLGSPLELPMLAALYPTADPEEIIEDLDDEELALVVRMFDDARHAETFERKLKEQMLAKILARTGTAGRLIVNGARCKITRIPVRPTICEPHEVPKEVRKPSVQTKIKVERTPEVAPSGEGEGIVA
jgi:hypothetical protein